MACERDVKYRVMVMRVDPFNSPTSLHYHLMAAERKADVLPPKQLEQSDVDPLAGAAQVIGFLTSPECGREVAWQLAMLWLQLTVDATPAEVSFTWLADRLVEPDGAAPEAEA